MRNKIAISQTANASDHQLEEELRRLRVLSDAFDEEIYAIDPKTHEILFANSKMKKRFGKNVVGKKCYKVFQNQEKPCSFCNVKQITGKYLGKTYVRELQNQKNKHWYRSMGKVVRWPDRRYVRYGLALDIDDQKKTEEALRESEHRFRSIVENSHDGIAIIDDKFRVVYANGQLCRIVGYPKKETIGQDFRKILTKESRKTVTDKYRRRLRGEQVPSQYEFRIVQKNGTTRDIEIKSSLFKEEKTGIHVIGQLLDITERKRMEEQKKSVEERLSALNIYGQSLNQARSMDEIHKLTLDAAEKTLGFEIASVLMIDGRILRLAAQRGYSKDISMELPLDGKKGITVRAANKRRPIYVSDVRKDRSYTGAYIAKTANGTKRKKRVCKNGIRSELAVPIKLGSKVLGILNVESKKLAAFDEEARKLLQILASHAATAISNLRRQEQVREFSKKLSYLMENTTEIMHVNDMRQRLRVIARAMRRFGWRRVVISLRDENLEGTDLVTSGLTKEENKLLMKRKASGDVWRDRLGSRFDRFKIGEFYYLPWSDPWIREYVHHVPSGASPDDTTTYTGVPSRLSAKEMVDWHPQDMLYAALRTPEGKIVGILSMDDPVDGRRPTKESLAALELFLHKAAIIIENAHLIEDLREAREQLEQKVEDRTRALRESQEQLLKAQRLAVIGELSGMVGHDLRNPLTSITAATYYVKMRTANKTDEKTKEMLELIEKNIAYANKIIDDLLDYSREVELELSEDTPKSLIEETLSFVDVPENVNISDRTKDTPRLMVDVDKLKRAFVNMIKNALDAMPDGGTLSINSESHDGHVRITFRDTGFGMSKETIRRLWTPLFTTKAKGMGFGLPICKRVVEAHGGSINVESKTGKGTTFTITIPIEPKTKEEGGENVWVKTLESSLLTTTKT